jgi:flavin-dependent dehydrogenase
VLPGYAWVFPLGDGWFNMGCGVFHRGRRASRVNLRDTFAAFTERFPTARAIWRQRTDATPLAGARLRCGLEPDASYDGRRTVAVGETIAATFPFTGEGIGKAMETAELAADLVSLALRLDDPQTLAAYPTRLDQQVAPRYDGYLAAERWIRWPRLTDFVAARVAHNGRLRRAAAGVLSETADPRQIFSVRALAPTLLPWRS